MYLEACSDNSGYRYINPDSKKAFELADIIKSALQQSRDTNDVDSLTSGLSKVNAALNKLEQESLIANSFLIRLAVRMPELNLRSLDDVLIIGHLKERLATEPLIAFSFRDLVDSDSPIPQTLHSVVKQTFP
jgi:hypothetical protein